MNTKFNKFQYIIIALLLTCSVYGQTVDYDGQTPNRPTAIHGLVVKGITYNLTFTYNVPIDGTELSGVDAVTGHDIIFPIVQLLNAQGKNSDGISLYIVREDSNNGYNGTRISDSILFSWGYAIGFTMDLLTGDQNIAIVKITLAPVLQDTTAPIPTMSQWSLLIFGLLIMNLSVFFVKKREFI